MHNSCCIRYRLQILLGFHYFRCVDCGRQIHLLQSSHHNQVLLCYALWSLPFRRAFLQVQDRLHQLGHLPYGIWRGDLLLWCGSTQYYPGLRRRHWTLTRRISDLVLGRLGQLQYYRHRNHLQTRCHLVQHKLALARAKARQRLAIRCAKPVSSLGFIESAFTVWLTPLIRSQLCAL